ncbi:MAG: hypothetical protein B6I26_04950 [Desulfobacteraceae bacterium 4572_130]|nr:MAG: hypothetical protein B6I26_04950 [Desulfobacteraceae bacterium 4572_130]
MEYFYSINKKRSITLKIKRSTFICTLQYVENILQAKKFISEISKNYKNATHNCWAYILGEKGEISHFSDQGEPSGTAGKPMLYSLQKNKITNIAVVVTRYFGGVKLGIKGIINAYSDCVTKCIKIKKLRKIVKTRVYNIKILYSLNDIIFNKLQKFNGQIKNIVYTDVINFVFEVEDQDFLKLKNFLEKYQRIKKLDFILKE